LIKFYQQPNSRVEDAVDVVDVVAASALKLLNVDADASQESAPRPASAAADADVKQNEYFIV
jgi:hypothetical protein